ncbi:hypothetical protein KFE25_008357 [Diacronema lutheri]|uniref:Mannosyltransferase n=1 Tax=Diacronema lutheri TaxID=2081491 RepID=A0A8J5XLG0_DIALT|nr:hypothetical protein KFE25_008357 [Diacronema lutheri]
MPQTARRRATAPAAARLVLGAALALLLLRPAACGAAAAVRAQSLSRHSALCRVRGGSDLLQPTVPSDRSYDAAMLGRLHVLWFPARRAALKGLLVAALVARRLRAARPPAGPLADSGAAWLGARLFCALVAGLLARAVDWKLLGALALAAQPLARALDGASGAGGGALDMTCWPGGLLPELCDRVF